MTSGAGCEVFAGVVNREDAGAGGVSDGVKSSNDGGHVLGAVLVAASHASAQRVDHYERRDHLRSNGDKRIDPSPIEQVDSPCHPGDGVRYFDVVEVPPGLEAGTEANR